MLLLNVLLMGRINVQPIQPEHFWANLGWKRNKPQIRWVQHWYFADIGNVIRINPSPPTGSPLEELSPPDYYTQRGHDGKALRVPTDLDESICCYRSLAPEHRDKFDRALFWMDIAARQWTTSMSSSFASLVSAVESLTERGETHVVYCRKCRGERSHDAPGLTELFRRFFETYAPGRSLRERRSEMYQLRSGILHGSGLISFDEGRAFGWDPPWRNQNDLHQELWSITEVALRNWLKGQVREAKRQ